MSVAVPDWKRELDSLASVPILDGLEWELNLLMDHSDSVGVIKEPISGVVGDMPSEDNSSEG